MLIQLKQVVVTDLRQIVKKQLNDFKKSKAISDYSLNLENKEGDSSLVTSIKKELKRSQEESEALLGTIGADLILYSNQVNEDLVQQAKLLRKQADNLLEKARKIHNTQQHLLEKGDSLPLAEALGLEKGKEIEEYLSKVSVTDYFGNKKKKEA